MIRIQLREGKDNTGKNTGVLVEVEVQIFFNVNAKEWLNDQTKIHHI